MRRAAVLALATLVLAAPCAGGAETSSSQAVGQSTTSKKPAVRDELLTPEQEGRQGVVKGVLVQPFRDFGLVESKIPRVLIEAMADPYARVTPGTCEAFAVQIHRLDAALGPDADAPVATEHPSQTKRGEAQARTASLDAMRGAEQSYIPFDGAIRFVSGADRHDHKVLAAIKAGAMRRAYLKGLGEAQGCGAPATPLHLAHPVTVAADGEPHAKQR
jgi:hypothetical protein